MQEQIQTNNFFVIYKYFENIINFMMNNIYEIIQRRLYEKKDIDVDDDMIFISEINQDEWPWPYDDLDYKEYSYINSYDGYDGYDN